MTMMHRSIYHIILSILFVVSHEGVAFLNAPAVSRCSVVSLRAALSPEEERAAALSDYLAKSHIEKLKAIKEIEMKKNSEIEQLKQQIAELKSSSSSSPSSMVMVNGGEHVKSLEEMSKEELVHKITQYQNFMRQYMIDAQEQKYRAVKAAEEAARQKLAESLTLLGLPPSSGTATPPPLYAARNAAVAKAAAAGKSRWGPMEVQRVGASVSSVATTSPVATTTSPLYAARNAAVTKAAAAGQSRWGSAEVQRVSAGIVNGAASSNIEPPMAVNGGSAPAMKAAASVPSRIPVPPEVADADHGLRSDGSIGGLTLAERVFYGATPPSAAVFAPAIDPREALFARRNVKVLQAAQAGHSRWGPQEIERVANMVAVTPPLPGSSGVAPAAPSSQRVNFGAAILGQQ